jgi:hypothetical protein
MKHLLVLLMIACSPLLAGTIKLFTGETLSGEIELGEWVSIRTEAGPTVKVEPPNIQRIAWRESIDGYPAGVVLKSGARLKAPAAGVSPAEIAWIVYRAVTSQEAGAMSPGKTGALLPGGDFFEGDIRSADPRSARVVSPVFGPRSFEGSRGEILVAVLAPVKPLPSAYEVRTTGGELLLADQVTFASAGATLVTAGKSVLIATPELAEVRAGAGRSMPLATARMARMEAGRGFPPGKAISIDAMADGSSLQIGPDRFEHGLVMYSGCAGIWDVPANFTELAGRFGVGPATPPNVRLTFSVLADGRSVFRSQPITSADAPQVLRASLGTSRTVALRVETQFPSGAIGVGIWVEPTLLRR